MIAPELLSNDELERLAYQQNDPLLRAMADRLCDHAEDQISDPDEMQELQDELDDAESRAAALADLCVLAAEALRVEKCAERYPDLIKKLEAA